MSILSTILAIASGRRNAGPRGPRRKGIAFESLEGRRVPAVLHVGPTEAFKLPSQAATAAHDGDTILIDAGTYPGDLATFNANNLTIEGVGHGRAKVDASNVAIPNRKAIWLINGTNTTVENVELSGAHDKAGLDKNWAGIREQGSTLTILNSYFHDDDDGILVNAGATSDITIKGSVVRLTTDTATATATTCTSARSGPSPSSSAQSTDAVAGHLVKSRAQTNKILYNQPDRRARTPSTSYELDLPNGGASYVIGNVIEQGPKSANSTIVSYAEEGAANPVQELYFVNNTVVNDLGRGTFVNVVGKPTDVRLINNIFAGGGTILSGVGTLTTNLVSNNPGFVNAAAGHYQLKAGSPAIDAGTDPGTVNGVSLAPAYEYGNLSGLPRPKHGKIDIGAYEY